ncbi:uncharacterized protein LOC141595635 [Silene latifolia]|uniref:uncharacterized protein LOC141595635 n=1 Tax=Silene latifolia TaxID=37657 RepID=UPI003D76DFEE
MQSDKLDATSDKCRFVSYPKETMGYYFYHPYEHKVFVARTATFLEKEFLEKGSHGVEIDLDEIRDTNESALAQEHEMQVEQPLLDILKLPPRVPTSSVEVNNVVNEPVQEPRQQEDQVVHEALRRSNRERRAPDRLNLIVQNDEDDHMDDILVVNDDPMCFKEAMACLDHEKSLKAMESEMESMRVNKVWDLVD